MSDDAESGIALLQQVNMKKFVISTIIQIILPKYTISQQFMAHTFHILPGKTRIDKTHLIPSTHE